MSDEASAPRRRRLIGRTWFQVVLALVIAGVVFAFLGQPSSGSMSPTLEPGDRIIVNRLAYVAADPHDSDIVVFRPGDGWERPAERSWLGELGESTGIRPYVLVKRVIGEPGQTVECCDAEGSVVVDGQAIDEPYVVKDLPFEPGVLDCSTTPRSTRCFAEVTVPERSYLVLGDNRANSADSVYPCRGLTEPDAGCWRWMSRDDVYGKVGPILWPIGRWGGP